MSDASSINTDVADDEWVMNFTSIPAHWSCLDFDAVFENVPLTGLKIPQKEYEQSGRYPVIDQGSELVGGYTNDADRILSLPRPAIVFGDHTKCFKYLSTPFAPGADGIKVLLPKEGILEKYVYHLCKSLRLPDRGYSRHFSFLKKCKFPVPPVEEQKDIVEMIESLLSKLDSGIESLKTAREQLKVYRQAVLKHAFEGKLTAQWRAENKDKFESPEQLLARIQHEREALYQQQSEEWKAAVNAWEACGREGKKPSRPKAPTSARKIMQPQFEVPEEWTVLDLEALATESMLGKMLDKEKNSGIERPYLGNINVRWGEFNLDNLKSMKIESSEIDRYSVKAGDLVICEGGEPGRCAVWKGSETTMFIQKALHRVRFPNSYSSKFAYYYMVYATPLERVTKRFTGTTIKHLTGAGLNGIQFPVCSLVEQRQIVDVLESKLSEIEALSNDLESQLGKSNSLRQSILKRAFIGALIQNELEGKGEIDVASDNKLREVV